MTRTTYRKGIAMIELIFAIVIMGIVLMSAPMLISQATSSSTAAFQQESIAIASAHANALSTYAWDEQNTIDFNPKAILNVTTGNAELAQQDSTTKRGTTYALTYPSNRTRKYSDVNATIALDATPPADFGRDGNFTALDLDDDIDDYTVIPLALISDTGSNQANQGEYMDTNIIINTSVVYGNDDASSYTNPTGVFAFSKPFNRVAPAGSSNIKLVTVTLTSNEASLSDKSIVLRSFMCNIGAAASRDNPGLY